MYTTPQERISGLTAFIYRRKSQEDKSRQILSLSTQADICDELTEHWKLQIVNNYSECKSAKIPDQRVWFSEMMTRIERSQAEVIVCWKIDRLVRNMKEGGWVIDALQNGKLKAIVTKEKIYLPEDNTIITAIEMAGATEYSRELSKKIHDANAKKARKGIPNKHAILGYLNNTHKEQGERDWRDDPERWHHCKKALYKILKDDMIPYHAFLWLRDEVKMTTPRRRNLGGIPLSTACFYRFLRRSEIAGFFQYKGEDMKINGCITPMITEEEYWQLQVRLGRNGTPRKKKELSLYSGFVFSPTGDVCTPDSVDRVTCDCKNKFSIKTKTVCSKCQKDVSEMQHPIFYFAQYYYNVRLKRTRQKTKGLNEKRIDEAILSIAKQIQFSPKMTQWSQKYLHLIKDMDIDRMKAVENAQEKQREQLEKRKRRAKEGYLDGFFTKEEYQAELEKLNLEELHEKAKPESVDWYSTLYSLTTLGQEIIHVWENGTTKEKRTIFTALQSNLCWDEEKLHVYKPKWLECLIEQLPAAEAEIEAIEPMKSVDKQDDYDTFRERFPTMCRKWELIRTHVLEGV